MNESKTDCAGRLAEVLRVHQRRVVFAESCTAGLIAATLGSVAGISEFLCGSMVVYRGRTKVDWLGVEHGVIEEHSAVSSAVAEAMAIGVLRRTEEADFAASITGHLGPGAPAAQDGLIYIGFASRPADGKIQMGQVVEYRLRNRTRDARRFESVEMVINELARYIIAAGGRSTPS